MTSQGALKWLNRLQQPRTFESLIAEIYGEATWFGCLLEREVAWLLNYHDMTLGPIDALTGEAYDAEDWTLPQLVQELEKKNFLLPAQLTVIQDGKDARHELMHRLVANELVVSQADKELLVAKIDRLYFRVWKAGELARELRRHYAEKLGLLEEHVREAMQKKEAEARIEDENIRRILGLGSTGSGPHIS